MFAQFSQLASQFNLESLSLDNLQKDPETKSESGDDKNLDNKIEVKSISSLFESRNLTDDSDTLTHLKHDNESLKLIRGNSTDNIDRDLTIFGFILYINYFIFCMNSYIFSHNSIIEHMLYVCEKEQGFEYKTDPIYISFHEKIKEDVNGIELLDSIIGAERSEDDFKALILYLRSNESYHYFLKEYIKNNDLFKDFTEGEDFHEFLKKTKVRILIEFYDDLPKDENTDAFIRNIERISSNIFISRFIKFQESWSKKKHIKTFFEIKPRTKINFLWMRMDNRDRQHIISMVKQKVFPISFMHRNKITTLETVIDRLILKKEISNMQ